MEKVQQLLQQFVDRGEIAGAALIVRENGAVKENCCIGWADAENRLPVRTDSVFRLASMTKPVMAVLTLMLEEKGLLSLEDPVEKYIPAFASMKRADREVNMFEFYMADPNDPLTAKRIKQRLDEVNFIEAKTPIMLRHLLNHSSGLGQGMVSDAPTRACMVMGDTLEQRVEKYAATPLDFEPGTGTGYSAVVGFEVLGRVLELASGMPLDALLKQELLQPLGIRDMGFLLDESARERIVRLYRAENGTLTDVSETDADWARVDANVCGLCSAAAGMYGTAEAYDRFAQLLSGEGEVDGVRLLRAETVRRIPAETAAHGRSFFPGTAWGLGMVRFGPTEETHRFVGEGSYGWSGAYGTHFYIDPLHGRQLVLMINRSNIGGAGSPVSMAVEQAVFEELNR